MPASTLLPRVDWRLLERQAQRLLAQWRELLTDDVADARPARAARGAAPIHATDRRDQTRVSVRRCANDRRNAGGRWDGVPGQNRTAGLALRRRSLYPTELRGRGLADRLVYQLLRHVPGLLVANRRSRYRALTCNGRHQVGPSRPVILREEELAIHLGHRQWLRLPWIETDPHEGAQSWLRPPETERQQNCGG